MSKPQPNTKPKPKPQRSGAFDELKTVAGGTRTLVLGPYATRRQGPGGTGLNSRLPEARLAEAVGLAAAIDLNIIDARSIVIRQPRPATYIGSGKVEELALLIKAEEIALAVLDTALGPVQQRNLETAWGCKVIDRTGLILEIFGNRARTKEGALQVELAHLNYQKSRLVRSWTHLERQRGGFGFLGGPGETQIETDRRLIQERVTKLQRELDDVRRTRALNRASRAVVPFPSIVLVGYTNAGKSTLFNRLTQSNVMARDLLFATLDPTARAIKLPRGLTAILTDTVGFISDLPPELVAAFRATLEDVTSADIILHVRDIIHADSGAQAADVAAILDGLGISGEASSKVIEVWNKTDLLDAPSRGTLLNRAAQPGGAGRPVAVSAISGDGLAELCTAIEARLSLGRPSFRLALSSADGAGLSWLYEMAEVLARQDDGEGTLTVDVRVPFERAEQLKRRFANAVAL